MRILYLADIRFPIERANGIQTMETCYALAERGHEILLLVRPDTATPPRDPFVFYDLAPQARLRVRQQRRGVLHHAPDVVRRLAHGHAADGVAGQFNVGDPLGRPRARVEIRSALHDAEERLLRRASVRRLAPFKPAHRALVGDLQARRRFGGRLHAIAAQHARQARVFALTGPTRCRRLIRAAPS